MALPMIDQDGWLPADTFGSRLALVRQHRGWNMKQAADACGITTENWRQWEKGQRQPRDLYDMVAKIAKASGAHATWLLAGDVAVPRSRCFSSLSLVSDLDGQMELDFTPARVLASV